MKKIICTILVLILLFSYVLLAEGYASENCSVGYIVHLQDKGWVDKKYNGQTAGTTGESRRMEAIAINLSEGIGKISYKVHCETYGWMNTVTEGNVAGTTGESKRLEAIIIYFESGSYSIKYRVHVQDYGWMNWVNCGEVAGTTGQSKRIEAIEIKLEKKAELNIINNKSNEEKIIKDGIDVSKYQGKIDWKKVKNSGIDFAIIRCGYRGYTAGGLNEDEYFKENVEGAYKNGIDVGIYFYSSAINKNEVIEEANFVLNLVHKYGFDNVIKYPIAYDIEDFEGTRNFTLSKEERTELAKKFCEIIKGSGFTPAIYSYTYFLDTKLDMDSLNSYDTWIADYYGNTWYDRKFNIWQYTSSGKVDGISGNVDMNYCYVKY